MFDFNRALPLETPHAQASNNSTHVVLKSDPARGAWSLLHRRNRSKVEQLIRRHAAKTGVRVYRHANVGNHLHLLVKAPHKPAFQRFLRTITGLIARHVTQARKGHSLLAILRSEGLTTRSEPGNGTRLRSLLVVAPLHAPRPLGPRIHCPQSLPRQEPPRGRGLRRCEAAVGNEGRASTPSANSKRGRQTAVIVVGAPDFRPGHDDPREWLARL